MRDCFHLVSLFKTLSRLMHEKMFRQQKGVVSPISKVSAVSSGCSPITQEGKSRSAMLRRNRSYVIGVFHSILMNFPKFLDTIFLLHGISKRYCNFKEILRFLQSARVALQSRRRENQEVQCHKETDLM